MKIACQHWRECNNPGGGCCQKNLYGGRPTFAICLHECREYEGPPREASTISRAKLSHKIKYIVGKKSKKNGGCNCKGKKTQNLQSQGQLSASATIYGPKETKHGQINFKPRTP